MKKILSSLSITSVLVLALSGCLKDKGFEDNEYGINNPSGSGAAVGFYKGITPKNGFGVNAVATSQTIPIVLSYTGTDAPAKDVTVTLSLDNSLVTSYNTANGTSTVPATATQIVIPATVVIPAGQRTTTFNITVPNATVFDPTKEYGIGLKIASVDNNVKIASNLQNLFVAINIKNKYDGRYQLRGHHTRAAYPYDYDVTMDMITSGPNSVRFWIVDYDSYGHPIGTAPGVFSWYGSSVSPDVYFDVNTNLVTDVKNADPTGPPISIYAGPGSGQGRYDPATKTMYVYFRYNANDLRGFVDTLTYKGPRP
jgi:hypothetical protein